MQSMKVRSLMGAVMMSAIVVSLTLGHLYTSIVVILGVTNVYFEILGKD